MSRNQKVWILSHLDEGPVAAFDNESAAYESHEDVQDGARDGQYFTVSELPLRKNKLNAETIRKIVSGQ